MVVAAQIDQSAHVHHAPRHDARRIHRRREIRGRCGERLVVHALYFQGISVNRHLLRVDVFVFGKGVLRPKRGLRHRDGVRHVGVSRVRLRREIRHLEVVSVEVDVRAVRDGQVGRGRPVAVRAERHSAASVADLRLHPNRRRARRNGERRRAGEHHDRRFHGQGVLHHAAGRVRAGPVDGIGEIAVVRRAGPPRERGDIRGEAEFNGLAVRRNGGDIAVSHEFHEVENVVRAFGQHDAVRRERERILRVGSRVKAYLRVRAAEDDLARERRGVRHDERRFVGDDDVAREERGVRQRERAARARDRDAAFASPRNVAVDGVPCRIDS